MKGLAAALLLTGWMLQEVPTIVPGDSSTSRWPISGRAAFEDETELFLRARRIVRRWDSNRKLFTEMPAEGVKRIIAVISGNRYDVFMKADVPGRYAVALSTEEKVLASDQLTLGLTEPLFSKSPEKVSELLAIGGKAEKFLDEIESIVQRQSGNSDKEREAFLRRVADQGNKLDEIAGSSDLTGTAYLLREVLNHIRNVQIWEDKDLPPPALDDPPRQKKLPFADPDMNLEKLRKQLSTVPDVLSMEIKVSTTLILDLQLAQCQDVERRKETARASARAAARLVEAAPLPDKDLIKLLEQTADAATDPAAIRPLLREAGQAHVVR